MIRTAGCDTVYVMPNLQPPITQISQARRYHETLTRLAPGVRFLMSLFLHATTTPETIAEAARSDIIYGVSGLWISFI
jgi:dihydroorotase